MSPTKITKIEISDFRAFPGPSVYSFEFGTAQNLFVHGENGSGKSSLFQAIREFLNRDRAAKPFLDFKNIDSPAATLGQVTLSFSDGSLQSWSHSSTRPAASPASFTALQTGCLDYRSLLETNFSQEGETVNIFKIAVRHLVPNLEVPVGGRSEPIGALWARVKKPSGHYRNRLAKCNAAVAEFNEGFAPLVKPLIEKAGELLAKFPTCDFTLSAAFQPIRYDTTAREFRNTELVLSVYRNGSLLPNRHNFLNEARLSAVGLVIYLAGLLIRVPTTSPYPKLLVLDDVLVGLDMENRAPVLEILAQYFSDWQVILLTYDKVWYEMVQVEMEGKPDWRAYELWLGPDGSTPMHRPRGSGPEYYLTKATEALAANDEHYAALHARMAFEVKVKKYCDTWSIRVPYKKDPKAMPAQSFWTAAKARAVAKAPTPGDATAVQAQFLAVETAKRIVLNPLSHSPTQPVTRSEVQSAINAVRNLVFPIW